MRILIDLQGAQSNSRHRGIGRYTLALAIAMVRNKANHEVHILLNGMLPETIRPIRNEFAGLLSVDHIHVWHSLAPVNANDPAHRTRRQIAALIREDAIARIQPDVVHITSLYDGYGDNAVHSVHERASCPVAVTFYDAIPLIQSSTYLDPDPVYRAHYMECMEQIQKADILLAISESARQEAITHLHFSPEQVSNISSAVDACFIPMSYSNAQTLDLQNRLGVHKPFVMYSGATDERKNHRGLISAFAQLPKDLREKYQLVLAGGLPQDHRNQLEAHIHANGLDLSDVCITGRISDADMIQLYNQCTLYVFPSWHEGFGLPALEAMSCGAPTIGSNTTSVPEVIGWERALFDPYQPSSIAQKISEALSDSAFLHALKAHAPLQAAKFSWDKSARLTISALEKVSPHKSHQPSEDLITAIGRIASQDTQIDLSNLSQAIARNAKPVKRQLLVDISELIHHDARTGIQRVVRSILHQWLSEPPVGYEVRPVYATVQTLGYRYADQFVKSFMGYEQTAEPMQDAPIDFSAGDSLLVLDMQPQVQVFQAPFFQYLRELGVDVRFVIYDLLPISIPDCFPEGAKENHSRWVSVAAESDGVLCISQAVAHEFEQWRQLHMPAARPMVNWFHMGADIENSRHTQGLPANATITLEKLAKRPTFLIVGTLEPRKGHTDVLNAMDELWHGHVDANLVIVGKQGWHVDELAKRLDEHPEKDQRLFWLKGISDEYLSNVYARADCLIAASYGEGFGLPLIEAAQMQLPIIARNIPVFREVAGDHAYYFDTDAPGSLQQAMLTWLQLDSEGKAPPSKDMPWLSWKQSATQLLRHLTAKNNLSTRSELCSH